MRAAAGTLSDRSILIQPLCLSALHHVDLKFNFGPPVKLSADFSFYYNRFFKILKLLKESG